MEFTKSNLCAEFWIEFPNPNGPPERIYLYRKQWSHLRKNDGEIPDFIAGHYGVSLMRLQAWLRPVGEADGGCVPICQGTTKSGRPCRDLVQNYGSYPDSPKRFIAGVHDRCRRHQVKPSLPQEIKKPPAD